MRSREVLKRTTHAGLSGLSAQVYDLLKQSKKRWSTHALSSHFDVGMARIDEAISHLDDSFVTLHTAPEGVALNRELSPVIDTTSIPLAAMAGREVIFGLTADNHLGSRYSRLDVLEALFDIWASEGVETVYQLGNIIDGEARFNKFDIVAYGIEGQVDYLVRHWPQRPGITTMFITGDDHEGWYIQREGIDIGRYIQHKAEAAGRSDLVYLGHMEHDLLLGDHCRMRLIHAGGGSAYALSYAPQKIIESYTGGTKPDVLLIGHYHKAEYGYVRNVHYIQAGATQDQTPFMRKQKIQSHVGGWTVRFTLSESGHIHRFQPTWDPFYDREYYERQWKYGWNGTSTSLN